MDSDKLQSIYNDIVGKNQEHIILDHDAPFDISEYENIFTLNETLENLSDCGLDDDMLTALFKVNPDRDEVLEAIENGAYTIVNVDEVSAGWNISFGKVNTASNEFSLSISSFILFITPLLPIAQAIGSRTAKVA